MAEQRARVPETSADLREGSHSARGPVELQLSRTAVALNEVSDGRAWSVLT